MTTEELLDQISAYLLTENAELHEEWSEMKNTGGNPCKVWNQKLEAIGIVDQASYEWHHGEFGLPVLHEMFHRVINANHPPLVVVDFDDGSNMTQTYVFDRKKAETTLQGKRFCV
jgi:hypothetical protein